MAGSSSSQPWMVAEWRCMTFFLPLPVFDGERELR